MKKKVLVIAFTTCLIIMSFGYMLHAATYTKSFNTTSEKKCFSIVNDTSSGIPITSRASVTTGMHGVRVEIRKSNNNVVAHRTYPYYNPDSVSSIQYTVPSGEVRNIFVRPEFGSEQIIGNARYTI